MPTLPEIFAADFAAQAAELPTAITFGEQTATGSFTELRTAKPMGDAFYQNQADAEATICPDDFDPAVTINDVVEVDSVEYRVTEIAKCPSGATQRLTLVRSL